MTGWSSKPEWPNNPNFDKAADEAMSKASSVPWPSVTWPEPSKEVREAATILADAQADILKVTAVADMMLHGTGFTQAGTHVPLQKVYNNKMPTHDPYTNPNAQVYYQCKCGAILDPGTKSFASLNNHASNAGWKVRWKQNGEGYEPFCVECGKDVD